MRRGKKQIPAPSPPGIIGLEGTAGCQRQQTEGSPPGFHAQERPSHIADAHGLPQRRDRIGARGDEFLRDVPFKSSLRDGAHDRPVVEFLRLIYLVASRHSAGAAMRTSLPW